LPNHFMRLHVLVQGTVQGVGYRWFARKSALDLEIRGWVRNLPSGEVELEIEGDSNRLQELLRILKEEHPYAGVSSIQSKEIPDSRPYHTFEVRT